MGVSVSYEWYQDEYGGVNSPECFADYVGAAHGQVAFICGGKTPSFDSDLVAYRRAICAAVDAFAEFGEGQVGGFTIGDFRINNYENAASVCTEPADSANAAIFCGKQPGTAVEILEAGLPWQHDTIGVAKHRFAKRQSPQAKAFT